jgi:hypothetical protein
MICCIASLPIQWSLAQEHDDFKRVSYLVDFSDYTGGSVENWLQSKGFEFKRGAKDRRKLDLDVEDDALILEVKRRSRGFLFNELNRWMLNIFPKDVSYDRKINNEALILYIFFGYEKIGSGHFAVPNSPYFIALFLGSDDEVNKPYKGKYCHKSGRFVCLGNPKPNEKVTSEFDLIETFRKYFEKDEVPVISGISLGYDTTSSGDKGTAGAFINSIEFLE